MRTQLSSSLQLLNMVVKHGHSVFKARATQGKLAVRRKRTRGNGMFDTVECLDVHWFVIIVHSPAIRAASDSFAYLRSTASPNQ